MIPYILWSLDGCFSYPSGGYSSFYISVSLSAFYVSIQALEYNFDKKMIKKLIAMICLIYLPVLSKYINLDCCT